MTPTFPPPEDSSIRERPPSSSEPGDAAEPPEGPPGSSRSPADTTATVPTLFEQLGGIAGVVSAVVPVVIFVMVNTLAGLQPAIWSSLGAALAVGVWRLARREPLQPAVSGILGVALCAFIAYRTGEARGFFLYGIWFSLVIGLAFTVSVVVRRPLVGVLWSVLNSSDFGWRRDRRARFGYDVATVVWAVFFLARFGVQLPLYLARETTLLGVARLAMGVPLTAIAALVTIWAIRRAGRHSPARDSSRSPTNVDDPAPHAAGPLQRRP